MAFFGGNNTADMKIIWKTGSKPIADFMPTILLKAKDFATELTSHNVIEKDLHGESPIAKEHIDNNAAVRRMLPPPVIRSSRIKTWSPSTNRPSTVCTLSPECAGCA